MKEVYSFNPATREYLGPVVLDESDLSPEEPGVYLIPAGCVEIPPPAPVPGLITYWAEDAWEQERPPEPPLVPAALSDAPTSPPVVDLEQLRARIQELEGSIALLRSQLPSG